LFSQPAQKGEKKAEEGDLASSVEKVEDEVPLDNSDESYVTNMN
jgi:hypothetical protein